MPTALRFHSGTAFDLVLSHSVIEHVANPLEYLKEARRVLAPGGVMLLNTAPYLSSSGSHLPKYKLPFPLPLHLIVGRKAAFATARWTGRHRPHWLDADSQLSLFRAQEGARNLTIAVPRDRADLRENIRRPG